MLTNKYYNLGKDKLFNICRSLTGNGVKKTLNIIKKEFPKLKIYKVKSGTKVFDWSIPPEWNIKNAFVLDKNKNKIIDFRKHNLHLVSYSIPQKKNISKKNLLKKIYSLPERQDSIPYVTSYYNRDWGFCLSHKDKLKIEKKYKDSDNFKVVINSKLNSKGYLNYGEIVIKGKSEQEILISTYICHPSMANNELSGPIVSMSLIKHFSKEKSLNKTLRFIFIPETIGSITYLSKNFIHLKRNIIGGFNLSCIGDERQHSCMFTKYKDTASDRALLEAYKKLGIKYNIYPFLERGSDERQYNSPGIDLPIASIFRSMYGEYPEYHTSDDNFNLVTKKGINGGFRVAKKCIEILLDEIIPKNRIMCEPYMNNKKLYPLFPSQKKKKIFSKQCMNFLQYADGKNSLKKISSLININQDQAKKIYKILIQKKLIF